MSENRRQILQMLADGKITADEAERLITALEKAPSGAPHARKDAKYLRVLVEAADEPGGEQLTKVNIRVPVKLLRAGVKLAGLIPQEAREHVNDAMREKGISIDLDKLKPEDLDELIEELQDMSIDVDEAGGQKAKVKVFFE
jgi:polyhydroxyalkanoate synthesis regulator phasin